MVPHHAPPLPNGDSWGGQQCTNQSCPGAVPDARSVAPSDWSAVVSLLQSNDSAGPLTRDRPFAWVALASQGNGPMNVSTEHIPRFGEVAEEPLPEL